MKNFLMWRKNRKEDVKREDDDDELNTLAKATFAL